MLGLNTFSSGFWAVLETKGGHKLYEGRESGHGGRNDGQWATLNVVDEI